MMLIRANHVTLAAAFAIVFFGTAGFARAERDTLKLRVFVHLPNPYKARPLPPVTCDVTVNDRVTDYGLTDWRMPATGFTYRVNAATFPKGLPASKVNAAIDASFQTWTAADHDKIFTNGGAIAARAAKLDGTNAILFGATGSSAIAVTYVWYYTATGQLAEADMVFNKNFKWSITTPGKTADDDCGGVPGTFDVQNIATHEAGHIFGLDDLYAGITKDLTMYGWGDTAELKKTSLGTGDVLGAKATTP